MKKLTEFSYSDLNILKIGPGESEGYDVQFIFWPHFEITGLIVDEAIAEFDFRGEKIENQDYGCDYYNITKKEADTLISLCVGFSIQKAFHDSEYEIEPDDTQGNKRTLAEVLTAFEQWRKK